MMISYRRYHLLNRLHGGIGQEIFDTYKNGYTPKIWTYALSLYFHQGHKEPFSKIYFDEALKWEKAWDRIWSRLPYTYIYLTDDNLEREFEFRGYVKDLKINRNLYEYVSSNRPIKGHRWIHPKKFTNNINTIEKRPSYSRLYDNWVSYSLEGYTKILYSNIYV